MILRKCGLHKFVKNSANARLCSSTVDYKKDYPSERGHVVKSKYPDIILPNLTLDKYVWDSVRKWENKVATVCGVSDRKFTYAQLRDHSGAFAVRLQTQFKLNHNDVVAVCLPNIPEFPIATLGPIEAGLTVTTVNPTYTSDEIGRQLISSNSKLIITTCAQFKVVERAVDLAQKRIPIVVIRTESSSEIIPSEAVNFSDLIEPKGVSFSQLNNYNSSVEDVVFLPFSSGTTGLSKGVQLTHSNIVANSEQINVEMNGSRLIQNTTLSFQDVLPCVLPFFHIYGLTVTLFSKLALGCQLVTLSKFQPETFLSSIERYQGTVLHLAPPVVIFLGHHEKVQEKHVKHIRTVLSGAAPIGQPDAERFLSRAPNVKFIQVYGLTETSPVLTLGEPGLDNFTSVGKLLPSIEAKMVTANDPENKGLAVEEVGELLVRGPQVMKGYLNNEKATQEMIIENGWLRTGDLGYYDKDGNFYITDRLKELIKVKGFQVPPAELEELIRSHPKVLDAGVVGVSHSTQGEVPKAFVVAKKGVHVTEEEIKHFVAEKVVKYKWLEGGVTFLEAIPKNASGKILRRELRAKYC